MRATVVIIDSFGIGELPDAVSFGDVGSNTALHICERIPGPKWRNLKALGLGNASELLGNELPGCESVPAPLASFGVMDSKSPGKDTTTGHWETAGIILKKPFHTFPQKHPSFPDELVKALTLQTGRGVIGNKAASGTDIIGELGEEHMRTGALICYTSADSVFQIAAHEEVVPVEELYRICKIARKLCDPYQVARVIARPFTGKPGGFSRTERRKDFSIALPETSILEHLQKYGVKTVGVGKIGNIFAETGLSVSFPDKGNQACLDRTQEILNREPALPEFVFVNLVDTDMIYGHRRDVRGYFQAVAEIDVRLPAMLDALRPGDLFIISADHGCDPSFRGTDHTREYVPLLAYRTGIGGENLGIRTTHADIAQSLASFFGAPALGTGMSFL